MLHWVGINTAGPGSPQVAASPTGIAALILLASYEKAGRQRSSEMVSSARAMMTGAQYSDMGPWRQYSILSNIFRLDADFAARNPYIPPPFASHSTSRTLAEKCHCRHCTRDSFVFSRVCVARRWPFVQRADEHRAIGSSRINHFNLAGAV